MLTASGHLPKSVILSRGIHINGQHRHHQQQHHHSRQPLIIQAKRNISTWAYIQPPMHTYNHLGIHTTTQACIKIPTKRKRKKESESAFLYGLQFVGCQITKTAVSQGRVCCPFLLLLLLFFSFFFFLCVLCEWHNVSCVMVSCSSFLYINLLFNLWASSHLQWTAASSIEYYRSWQNRK